MSIFERTELLIGQENLTSLNHKTILIFGIGGVGSYVVEALARSGIGHFILVDDDIITESNINRQLIALFSTLGKRKVEVAKARICDINPQAHVITYPIFVDQTTLPTICMDDVDYIVDAIDTVTAKLLIVERAYQANIPLICAMGTGNKRHPEMLSITDIAKTHTCPLAKVMRTELRKRGIFHLNVLFSTERPLPISAMETTDGTTPTKRKPIGSTAFVPSVGGLLIASAIVNEFLKKES